MNDQNENPILSLLQDDGVTFRFTELGVTWGTNERWGKLILARPKYPRPSVCRPGEWEGRVLQGLLALRKAQVVYMEDGSPWEWRLIEEMTAEQQAETPQEARKIWHGWERLVLPVTFRDGLRDDVRQKGQSIPHHEGLVWLRDSYSETDESADTPGRDLIDVLKTLQSGGSVLVFGATERIPGFIPAAMAMLADPRCHIAKVIYPVRRFADLTQLQIGYLAGFSDARALGFGERHAPAARVVPVRGRRGRKGGAAAGPRSR
jgi:hypothetical protein